MNPKQDPPKITNISDGNESAVGCVCTSTSKSYQRNKRKGLLRYDPLGLYSKNDFSVGFMMKIMNPGATQIRWCSFTCSLTQTLICSIYFARCCFALHVFHFALLVSIWLLYFALFVALVCFALLHFALLCFTLLCFALLCLISFYFALLVSCFTSGSN